MYLGKILATFEAVAGKHRWVASATSRAKILYFSAQLFLYQPYIPIAAGFHSSSPNSRIFAHLEIVHLHHLFPSTEGLNIVDVGGNCVSIPQQLKPLLLSMSQPQFLDHWENEYKQLKGKQKKNVSWLLLQSQLTN